MLTRQDRNEAALKTLHPQFAVRVRLVIAQGERARNGKLFRTTGEERPMEWLIVQARRSRSLQEAIYQGKGPGGPGVVAAPPGHSFHELGLAADLVDLAGGSEPGRYDAADWNESDYDWLAALGETMGMVAGHRWQRQDSPHLEYHPTFGPKDAYIVAGLIGPDGVVPDDFFSKRGAVA